MNKKLDTKWHELSCNTNKVLLLLSKLVASGAWDGFPTHLTTFITKICQNCREL